METINKLKELVERINVHPDTKALLEKCDDQDFPWLEAGNVVNGHIEAAQEYRKLMIELLVFLDQEFITTKGQHSKMFYEIRNHGFGSRTGESDSFGPLSSILMVRHLDKDNKYDPDSEYYWRVCYG